METYNRNTCLFLDEKQFQEVTKKSALLDTSETLELGSMKVGATNTRQSIKGKVYFPLVFLSSEPCSRWSRWGASTALSHGNC